MNESAKSYSLLTTKYSRFSGALFLLFGVLASCVVWSDFLAPLDLEIFTRVIALRTPGLSQVLLFFTHLGSGAVIITLGTGVAFLWFLYGKKRETLFLIASVAVGQTVYYLFKIWIERARPDEIYALVPRGGYSFPSGHTTAAMLFYGLLAYFLYRVAKGPWLKYCVAMFSGMIIFLVGFSRIYLGAHWPSDVLGGWLIGGSFVALSVSLYLYMETAQPLPLEQSTLSYTKRTSITVGVLLFLAVFIVIHYLRNPLIS
jgi:undecaprenyl-diphosphatase